MKKIASGILVLILLSVTIGVPVFKHTCHVFDRSEVTLLVQKQCCDPGTENSSTKIDIKCCSLEQYDTSLDYETLVKEYSNSSISFVVVEKLEIPGPTFVAQESKSLPLLRPPPLANRDLLNRIQLYLI